MMIRINAIINYFIENIDLNNFKEKEDILNWQNLLNFINKIFSKFF